MSSLYEEGYLNIDQFIFHLSDSVQPTLISNGAVFSVNVNYDDLIEYNSLILAMYMFQVFPSIEGNPKYNNGVENSLNEIVLYGTDNSDYSNGNLAVVIDR
jgi:hypothetical protein